MRRSDRLADIIEIIKDGRLHLARDLADQLNVSLRTIYRDMDTLAASGVPVDGERGVGYMLREPVFLPPLSLSLTELEALHLGMAIVGQVADDELKAASGTLLSKVAETASNRRNAPKNWGFGIYPFVQGRLGFQHMPLVRQAIRERSKLRLDYTSLAGRHSQRVIWPLQTEYWGQVWTCTAWCEQRDAFRVFRIDRINSCHATGHRFVDTPGKTIEDYMIGLNLA